MRKGKDPDPYLGLTDPDPGGPKTYGSGTLVNKMVLPGGSDLLQTI